MNQNKRTIDNEVSRPSSGNQQPPGTGSHERHRVEAEQANEDPQMRGVTGRKAGEEKKAVRDGR